MHSNNMCVILGSFLFTKDCLMSPVCADIRPCFRKHVFHLHGLLSPGCFFPQIKKPWISRPFLPLHHLSLGKAKPPQHAWRTTAPVCRHLRAACLSPKWLPVDAQVFLHRASLCTGREEILVKGSCRQPLWDLQHLYPITPCNKVPPVAWDQVTSLSVVEVISLPTLQSLKRVWI